MAKNEQLLKKQIYLLRTVMQFYLHTLCLLIIKECSLRAELFYGKNDVLCHLDKFSVLAQLQLSISKSNNRLFLCLSEDFSYNSECLFVSTRLRNVCKIRYWAENVLMNLTLGTSLQMVLIIILPYFNKSHVTEKQQFVLHINMSAMTQICFPQIFEFYTVSRGTKAHCLCTLAFATPLTSSSSRLLQARDSSSAMVQLQECGPFVLEGDNSNTIAFSKIALVLQQFSRPTSIKSHCTKNIDKSSDNLTLQIFHRTLQQQE